MVSNGASTCMKKVPKVGGLINSQSSLEKLRQLQNKLSMMCCLETSALNVCGDAPHLFHTPFVLLAAFDCLYILCSAITVRRGCTSFSSVNVPHLRLAMATIHSIIQREDIAKFNSALHLLAIVHRAAPDLISIKQYVKLTTSLKTKVIAASSDGNDFQPLCELP